jgi:cell division protein FtsB
LLPREYIHHVNEEIALLRAENAKLKEQEINLTYIMSGLNTKLKMVEEEKKNLITAIKILQKNGLEGDTNTCKT